MTLAAEPNLDPEDLEGDDQRDLEVVAVPSDDNADDNKSEIGGDTDADGAKAEADPDGDTDPGENRDDETDADPENNDIKHDPDRNDTKHDPGAKRDPGDNDKSGDEARADLDRDRDLDVGPADDETTENGGCLDGAPLRGDELEGVIKAAEDSTVDENPQVDGLVSTAATEIDGTWSFGQARSVLTRAAAVLWVFGLVGFGLGYTRGPTSVVRTEFVYTLDESVPDSFLREDRRLLTQVVTLKSDAVLGPVAERFDLTAEDLRGRVDVETVDLSEVLRLEVTDVDRANAATISQAIIEQYLDVSSAPLAAEDSASLRSRRDQVVDALAEADAAVATSRADEAVIDARRAALDQRVAAEIEQINTLNAELNSLTVPDARGPRLEANLAEAEVGLAELQGQLVGLAAEASTVSDDSAERVALSREVERLEQDLVTIDGELARRELGPLVSSPVRELAEPTFLSRSATIPATQGAAIGLLAGLPFTGLVAYRARRRQLWRG